MERLKAELRHAVQRMVQSQAHRDQWQRKYEEAAEAARRAGVDLPKEPSDGALPEGHSTQEYLQRIADLESENARLKVRDGTDLESGSR